MKGKLGLGCWALGGDSYGAVSESDAEHLLKVAYEFGIRFFDTSPAYGDGESERRIGRYLSKNKGVLIATKVGMLPHAGYQVPYDFSKKQIVDSVNNSLGRLKRSCIDLLQLHSPVSGFHLEFEDVFDTLRNLIQDGKVASVGISLRSPTLLSEQVKLFGWGSFQYNLSLVDQRIRDYFDLLRGFQGFLIARTPLNFGFLTESPPNINKLGEKNHLSGWGKKQLQEWETNANRASKLCREYGISLLTAALRFPVDSALSNLVIPGARNLRDLMENIDAFNTGELPSAAIEDFKGLYETQFKSKVTSPYRYLKATQD